MRLSKIKLAGFKSFVDPTVIPLKSSLNGVVGPNGCGKSNVIDAVRWVMGETSAKNLRGDSMADVIFNGSTTRKPVGQASVELIFDNSDGTIGGQYASYAEIAIKRLVSRDGTSNYFLNGVKCRRRDITDIFLGTGLGPRSYAIIGQGTISRIIEAKPEELRIFVEEAAGISKYKERRRETETRIRHTRENLDRLSDLREELEKQLARLERQAATAERYKELKEEERTRRGQLLALRWKKLDGELAEQERQISEKETALEAQVAQQRSAESGIEKAREALHDANEQFNRVQAQYYAVGAEIARLEQAINHAHDSHNQRARELADVQRAYGEAQAHLDIDREKIEQLSDRLDGLEPDHTIAAARQETQQEALLDAEAAMQHWQQRWDQFNQEAAEPARQAELERARINHNEQQLTQIERRSGRLDEERGMLHTDGLEEELMQLDEEGELLAQQAEEERLQLEEVRVAIGEARAQLEQANAELDQQRTELQGARGRLASLEALQQAALGQQGGAVQGWLEQQGLASSRRLAEGIRVESGWERAAECVLGAHLQAVCVEGLEPFAGLMEQLDASLGLFDTRFNLPAGRAPLGRRLLDVVKSDWSLEGLLAGVYLAEGLPEALAMRAGMAAHESVITRDGLWLGPGWLRLVRDEDGRSGVLAREQEIEQIAARIAALEEGIALTLEGQEHAKQRQHAQEEGRDALQQRLNETTRRQGEVKAQASSRRTRLEQVRGRLAQLDGEREELREQRAQLEEENLLAQERLGAALERVDFIAGEREALALDRDQLREALHHARSEAQAGREALHRLDVELRGVHAELEATKAASARASAQLEQLAERREELAMTLAEGEAPIEGYKEELADRLEQRSEAELALAEARAHVQALEHSMREGDGERMRVEQRLQGVRGELEQLRMVAQALSVRRQTLAEQLLEGGYELKPLLEGLPEGAQLAEWESQLAELERRIGRLGPINLAAIDEYKQQAERKEYLDAQNADLMEALETLENAIRKIDRETRQRFKETFDKVNAGFQTKFPTLFGGGSAYLELTGDDLLDTGVTVMARPPGKRNSTIHLLSGGEKALSAVALVFSIFDLNPSPFCMLDEVDAPLDEANVGRFCNLVREMSAAVQFIFITHNKTTMELATHLSGVTMQEPGVSRLVAVDIAEAASLAAV